MGSGFRVLWAHLPLPTYLGYRVAQDSLNAEPFKSQPNSPGKRTCPQRLLIREKMQLNSQFNYTL